MRDSSMADSASFSNLLKTVLTNNSSSSVKFQGQYEVSPKGVKTGKPKAAEAQLELKAKCADSSTDISSPAPAAVSVPSSAPAISEPLSTPHEDMPRKTLEHRTPYHNSILRHIVMESSATDGYSWRKYGQKQVKGSKSSRSYYRCADSNCHAKKKVQRCEHSSQVIDTIYIGQHNHDLQHNKFNMPRGCSSSGKLVASSHIVNPDNEVDGAEMSICQDDARQTSLCLAESEQQSSSSSSGNIGIEVEEQKFYSSSKAEQKKKNSCGIANAEVQGKFGAEPGLLKRMKENSTSLDPVVKVNKEANIVIVHTAADGSMSSDGFRWRKYGQKMVKGNSCLRSYYRCTSAGCPSRKRVETSTDDATTSTTITYEGKHDHDEQVPKKQKGSKSLVHISPTSNLNGAHCKKIDNLSSQTASSSTKWSEESEGDVMDEKVLELGGKMALESAQTLLSIGIELGPC